MQILMAHSSPTEFLSELERKYFWWEPVGSQRRSQPRIVAQAMSFAGFEDIRLLEQMLGQDCLVETMLGAEPGWIDDRSWEFWRGRLMHATGREIPDTSPRRSFDVGAV